MRTERTTPDRLPGLYVRTPSPLAPARTAANRGPILWAVDPARTMPSHVGHAIEAIKLWRTVFPSPVVPVAVLSLLERPWPPELSPSVSRVMIEAASTSLCATMSRLNVKGKPRILVPKTPLLRGTVKALIRCARTERASVIVVGASGRKGFRRLGSFAELLIALSPTPVLTVSPKTVVPGKISHVFFPTDFSAASSRTFRDVLRLARASSARLTIYFQSLPVTPVLVGEMPYAVDAPMMNSFRELEARWKEKGERWVRRAGDAGVEARFVFSRSGGKTGERVVRAARRSKADLIVMVSHQGRIGQLLLGSVTRDVLELATCPVLVHHSS